MEVGPLRTLVIMQGTGEGLCQEGAQRWPGYQSVESRVERLTIAALHQDLISLLGLEPFSVGVASSGG